MDTKTFKKLLDVTLTGKGFLKTNNNYVRSEDEVICTIGLQKSSYSNSYYINIGFVIKDLHPELLNPKYFEADIRARFSTYNLNLSPDSFELDSLDEGKTKGLISCFNHNLNHYISDGLSVRRLKSLLAKEPLLLYQTSPDAKQILLRKC
jgi:hypothetical protein